ncbi:MAG: molecular chaperone GrpE [Solirubrobacteraceae bacterium]|nr:molecular chaperone GrpE [Solirubrobacteraceae bacterium]
MTEERDTLAQDEQKATGAEPVADGAAPDAAAPDAAVDDEQALAEDAAVEAPEPEPDWKDIALRQAAELENVRKQNAQRVQKASRDGMRRVAMELLPALDDFERALAHAEAEESDTEHHLTAGIRLVQQNMLDALRRAGIEAYSPKGERFDPHLHEAVAQSPVDGTEPGIVTEVFQAGYRLGDDVLRPARVVVAG